MNILYPLQFQQNFFELVWGGNNLKPLKGLPADDQKIGESWEVSAVPGKESLVANGALKGKKLSEVVEEYGELLLGYNVTKMYGKKFPLLIKFIDAAKDLSVQVHPDDALAKARHNSLGKTEMWFVMDAKPNAYLYSGFASPISKYEYEKRVEDGSICDVLARHDVHRGDVFFIPAGRVHAIGGGTMVAEIQQSSDITYRIFDYNRLGLDGKPRELHTELAKDAIDYKVYDNYKNEYEYKVNKPVAMTESPYFTVKRHVINRSFHRKLFKYDSFIVYMCLHGDCKIELRSTEGFDGKMPDINVIELSKGNSCLIPAACADVNLVPNNEDGITELLEVYIDNKNYNK
ncbi:MAG: class I mannose-6-phosphate isomerase [Bacteroidaceae bacterium]|nr:class I mannose-6-phosphate isomerase [Bacteroidaceae bacterium]